jgi:hypothetical protein
MYYVYHGKLQEIQRYGHFNLISKVQSFLMGLNLNKVAKLVKLYNWVKGLNQHFFDTKTVDITGLWVTQDYRDSQGNFFLFGSERKKYTS